MSNEPSKSDLLKQLKIEEVEDEPSSFGFKHLIITGAASAILGALIVVFFLGPREASDTELDSKPGTSESKASSFIAEKPAQPANKINMGKSEVLNASGYITARLIATVSAETMGLIKSVEVEEGMKVDAGQVLATLDDAIPKVNYRLSQAQLNAQRARLSSVQTDLAESQRVLQRITSLKEKDYSSQAQFTRAQADVEKLQATVLSMKADIEVAKMDLQRQQELLNDHIVRAPFAGVVTVKNAQPGEIVAPAAAGGGFTRTGICTIVDMDSLEIEVDVNEAYIRRVYAGQPVVANIDAYPSWDIPAKVIAIIPTADRAKATVRVRIAIELKDERILPDMGVKVAFTNDELIEERLAVLGKSHRFF